MSLLRSNPAVGQGSFWVHPYQSIAMTGYIDRAIRQNEEILQTGGEPCYLFRRNTKGEVKDRTFTSGYELHTESGFWRLEVWRPATGDDFFPDPRTFILKVDTETWSQVTESEDFLIGTKDYLLDFAVRRVDSTGVPTDDRVYTYFNTPPFDGASVPLPTVRLQYESIDPSVDLHSFQPTRTDTTNKSLWGFTQWLDSARTFQGVSKPHSFAVAFPDTPVDRALTPLGFENRFKKTHWISPPPYAPDIQNHDILVQANTGFRFVVTERIQWFIGTKHVATHMNLSRVREGSSYLDIALTIV